ncbi:RNA polymerase sigma factor [Actinoplanes utahensis]|nr:hypothetical protein Aut01nite_46710 [Actinoplanes utahensis]
MARLAAAGDNAALEALLAGIRPRVLRQCSRFLPCYQDAEEACQDVLLQVARNIRNFEGRSKFTTWLHVIVANGSRQTYRTLKRRAAEQGYAEMPVEVADARTTSVIAGSRLDLLDALERLEASRAELVAPMVLRDICQLDYREIATHLGIPEGTVKSRIHQARSQVREYLLAGL